MSNHIQTLILTFKILSITFGFVIVFLGYILLRIGVYEKVGEIEAVWKDMRLLIKRASAGTVLVVLGGFALIFSIVQGIKYKTQEGPSGSSSEIQAHHITDESINAMVFDFYSQKQDMIDSILVKIINGQNISEEERQTLKSGEKQDV
jgi:hypothetical protein